MNRPLTLDFDSSVRQLADVNVIELTDWQEAIRFGCTRSNWQRFRTFLDSVLPDTYGTVLTGSGDFHHVSHLLLERLHNHEPFDVVVLDNHPDNMRFPFGIHCGSWVLHAARLPQIRRIHVLGITSADVSWRHAWENHLLPIYRGKVCYWTIGVDTGWANKLGLAKGFKAFNNAQALIEEFIAGLDENLSNAVYLSIDKDVLAAEVARTNWDQGCLTLDNVQQVIAALAGRLIGSDITGEISAYAYKTPWKRWLSAADKQAPVVPEMLVQWQAQQMAVNRHLLGWLTSANR